MSGLLTIRLDPADYIRLLALLDSRIRSERALVNAFRARQDTGNQIIADGTRRQLLALREALTAGVKGGQR